MDYTQQIIYSHIQPINTQHSNLIILPFLLFLTLSKILVRAHIRKFNKFLNATNQRTSRVQVSPYQKGHNILWLPCQCLSWHSLLGSLRVELWAWDYPPWAAHRFPNSRDKKNTCEWPGCWPQIRRGLYFNRRLEIESRKKLDCCLVQKQVQQWRKWMCEFYWRRLQTILIHSIWALLRK